MMKPDTLPARAPRGTKPVSQAFFAALETIPEATRSAVAKAALTMIRDEMKARKDKLKLVAAKEKAATAKEKEKEKEKAKAPVVAKRAAKAAKPAKAVAMPPEPVVEPKANGAAPAPKRRARKAGDAPVAA